MFPLIAVVLMCGVPVHETLLDTSKDAVESAVVTVAGDLPQETFEVRYADLGGRTSTRYRAEELWVDRNHLAAIANEVAMSGSGQGILASWYLNNDRLSRYVISGTGSPLWSYDMPDNEWGMDVSAGYGAIFTGLSGAMGLFAWLTPSSMPSLELPPSGKQDMTPDGSHIVHASQDGTLACWDCDGDFELWSVQLPTTGYGVYGVEISGDGSRVLVSVYDAAGGAMVFDMSDGSQVGNAVGNYGQTKADISHDGARIVTGDFSGRIKLYEFDGTNWSLQGDFHTGDSWVTAVSISGDGQTAAGGTLGFSPYSGRVVAVDWPVPGPPSVMWQYTDYGDEVASVDICHDGSIIIAGSWGMYQGTSGDVVTVLDRDGAVIFNLLDDIDEPGSIFSVSVSDDGNYATASGKAVHAREFGNGGQVYGIRVVEAGDHDVAVTSIASPPGNLEVGDTVTPEVTVSNLGQNQETFPVQAVISEEGTGTVVWSGAADVNSLDPGGTLQVTFDQWTVTEYGKWIFTAFTDLPGDVFPENDTLSVGTGAYHDAKAKAVIRPYSENTVFMEMAPIVEVTNAGTYHDSFDAILEIAPSGGSPVYLDTVTTSVLGPGASQTLTFPAWVPDEVNSFTAVLTVELEDDINPDNDTVLKYFETSYEIIYDDGTYESYYWVGSQDDDHFATRFTPVLTPPMMVTEARLYVNSTDAFEWVALCADDGTGRPDVSAPLAIEYDLGVQSAPAWLEIPLDVWWDTAEDAWLVVKWYDAKALAVGTDMTPPHTGRSWWHNAQNGWVNFTYGDFSLRMTMEPSTGSEGTAGAPAVYAMGRPMPNPAAGSVTIRLSIPDDGAHVTVSIYDLSGRVVDTLAGREFSAGEHNILWDPGKASIATGIYFVRMDAPNASATEKLVIIR